MAYQFDTKKFYENYDEKVANQKKKQKTYNKSQYTSSVSSTQGFNYGSIAKRIEKERKAREKEREKEKLAKEQKAEIERQYQAEVKKNSNRQGVLGGVDRVFDVLSTGGFTINGLLQDGWEGAKQGFLGGIDGFKKEEMGKEYSFNDTLDKWSKGKWDNGWDDTWYKKAGKFTVNLAGEILVDPLTYLGGVGAVKSILKGTGKKATGVFGRTAVKEISEDAIVQAGKKLAKQSSQDVSKEVVDQVVKNATKYTSKANELIGNTGRVGDMTFGIGKAKVTFKGSGDVLRKIGDATISPYYNTLSEVLMKANPFRPITTKGKLRQQLINDNLEGFLTSSAMKDLEIASRRQRHALVNSTLSRANNSKVLFKGTASKSNKEAQAKMFHILDDAKNYDTIEELEFLGKEGSEMFDNFVEQMTNKSPQAMKDTTVRMVLDELKQSQDVVKTLKQPLNSFQEYVYKKVIDPENVYDNYTNAYQHFISKYHFDKKVNPISLRPPIQNVSELAVKDIKRFSPTDMETGLFINTGNAKRLGALLKQNQAVTQIVSKPLENKVAYFNDILFDGKSVITINETTERSLNQAIHALKNGADESQVFNALQETLDLSKNHAMDDLFMSTDEIVAFEKTMALPERYNTIDNRIATSGLVPSNKPIRIYNKETGELFYTTKANSNLDELNNVNLAPYGTITQHVKETASERVVRETQQLENIKDVVTGNKSIADTDMIETITREKEAIVNDYIQTLSKDLPDDLKEMVNDPEYLEWMINRAYDADGNIIPEEIAQYVGRRKNVEYAIEKGLEPKDLRKFDNVAYNSLNVMPKVQLSDNYSKTVRQLINGFIDDDEVKEIITEVMANGKLSQDAKVVASMMLNKKKDSVATMLLNAQLLEDAMGSPVFEVFEAILKELPPINVANKDYRKMNMAKLIEHMRDLFNPSSANRYSDDVVETVKNMDKLKNIYDVRNGKINSHDLAKNLMKAELDLPDELRTVKDLYTEVVIDADGVVTQLSYDPYTMDVTQQAVSRLIVDKELINNPIMQEENMTQLEHFLNHTYKSDVLNRQFTDFVTSTYNVPRNSKYVVKEGVAYAKHMDLRLKLDDPDLTEEMKQTLQFVFAELKQLGMAEHTAGKLETMLNAYVPHILNKDLFKNPNIMNKIKKKDPELYRMIFKSGGDKFNPNNIGRSTELEESVKRILGERYKRAGQDYTGNGKTVQEVNEALKPLLKSAGFDGDFFINNLYDAFAQRVVTHGDVLYSDKIIDQTLELFGKYVSPTDVKLNQTYYISQKDLSRFFKHLTQDQQYIVMQELGIDMSRTYNKMLISVRGREMEKFYNIARRWQKEIPELPNFVAYELPEQVAYYAQNKGYTQALEDTNVILKLLDKFTVLWKQTATVINPGFHLRNKMSNTFNTFLNCGADTFNPQTRKTVKEILIGKDGFLITQDGREISFQAIRDELVARDIVSYQNFNRLDNVLGDSGTSLFATELRGQGGIFEAIGRMLGKENPSKFNKIDPTDTANFLGFEWGRKFGGKIEDFDRTLNFVSRIRHGESFEVAHDMVNKFLFDYSDLTPFEMNVMKRIIPFYTWLRKNAPLQVEMLFTKPYVYSTVAHTHKESIRDADQTHLPSYMQEWFRLPVEFEGGEVYANVALPYQDLFMQPTPQEMIGMVNPLIKLPLEQGINKNIYFDTPIWNENDKPDEVREKKLKHMKSTLLGGYNAWLDATKAVASGKQKAILEEVTPLFTGITPKVYDNEKAKEDAIYRAIMNMEDVFEKQALQTKANKSFEEYKKTKLEKYGYSSDKK